MTARDPRLASHSLRDDERPSPRRPITMPRELWARIDAARGEQSCAEWLREAALAKLEARMPRRLSQKERDRNALAIATWNINGRRPDLPDAPPGSGCLEYGCWYPRAGGVLRCAEHGGIDAVGPSPLPEADAHPSVTGQ